MKSRSYNICVKLISRQASGFLSIPKLNVMDTSFNYLFKNHFKKEKVKHTFQYMIELKFTQSLQFEDIDKFSFA